MYSENQLSAHTSAVKVDVTPSGAAVDGASIVTSPESVIVVGDDGDEDDDEEANRAFAAGFIKHQTTIVSEDNKAKVVEERTLSTALLSADAVVDAWDNELDSKENEMAGLFD